MQDNNLKVGDLVRVVKNDMSLVIRCAAPKDNLFFNQIGTILTVYDREKWEVHKHWYIVLFNSGIYEAREDALTLVRSSEIAT